MSLEIFEKFLRSGFHPKILNLGGGYKVGRMQGEESTDLQECGEPVRQAFLEFAKRTGVKPRLEIEPGTFLTANASAVFAEIIDLKNTSDYNFIIINAGMTENTRIPLYAAQHPVIVVPRCERRGGFYDFFVVSGHCCVALVSLIKIIGFLFVKHPFFT